MNKTSRAAALALASFAASCAGGTAAPSQTPEPSHSAPATSQMATATQEPAADDLEQGAALFRDICAQCHTTDPPPRLAPPMRMVSMHLRATYVTRAEAVEHVVSYVRQPDAARSILPAHAVQRFGLMPEQPLPPELLAKVGAYVWTLAGDTPGMRRGRGRVGMRGPRGGMRSSRTRVPGEPGS